MRYRRRARQRFRSPRIESLERRLCLSAEYGYALTTTGPSSSDGFLDVEVDVAGNRYLSSQESLIKLSPAGALLWGIPLTGIMGLDLDGAGNLHVLGELGATGVTVPGVGGDVLLTSSGLTDLYVLKFNPAGLAIWGRAFGEATADQVPRGLAVDAAGNVAVTGYFSGTWTLGSDTLVSPGLRDGFVTRLSPAGDVQWARRIGGTGDDDTWDIDLDAAGNAYVTGGHTDPFTLPGGITIPVVPGSSFFVAKLTAAGDFVWGQGYGSANVHALVVDPAGALIIAGSFSGTVDFDLGPGEYPLTGSFDPYLLKLDLDGQFVWARALDGNILVNDLVIGSSSQVHLVGSLFSGTLNVTPQRGGNFLTATSTDPFAITFDSAGSLVAARKWGGSQNDVATGAVADGMGNLLVAGYFRGIANLDPSPTGPGVIVTSNGSQDGYLMQLTPPRGVIGGRVWNDVLANGVEEGNETGAAGIVLELRTSADAIIGNADDGRVALVTTNATGGYRIENLPSGLYYVVARTPASRSFTTPNAGADDTRDSDILATGQTVLFALDANQDQLDVDTGLVGIEPGFGYAVRAGSAAGQTSGGRVVVDAEGNSYVTGFFSGTVDFDPGAGVVNLTSLAAFDVFVAKYSATGALVWARQFGSFNMDIGYGLAVNSAGEVYVAGTFPAPIDLDPGPLTQTINPLGSGDVFIVKLTRDGDHVWSKRIGGAAQDDIRALRLDAAENVVLGGTFGGTVDFDPATATAFPLTSAGAGDPYILKLSPQGTFQSAIRWGGANHEELRDLDVDAAGNFYVTGTFRDTTDLDPTAGVLELTSAGGIDVFVMKLNASGSLAWGVRHGNVADDMAGGVRVDDAGNVYTSGSFVNQVDFGGITLHAASQPDGYLTKHNNSGQLVWARQVAGTQPVQNFGLDVDAAGNVYVAGGFTSTAWFTDPTGQYLFGGSNSQNAFVAKVSPAGLLQAFYLVAGTSIVQAYTVAVDRVSGRIHTTGIATGSGVDFDPGPATYGIAAQGSHPEFFLAQYNQVVQPRMTLTGSSFTESSGQQFVGTLGVANGLPGETFTYSASLGASGFSLSNNLLYVNSDFDFLFNFETSPTTTVQVQAAGSLGTQLSQVFNLQILNLNEPPQLFNILTLAALPGELWQASSHFFDPDQGDSWTATVNYGDGAGPQPLTLSPTKQFDLAHTYASGGTYPVTISVTDALGLNVTRTYNVHVLPPITSSGPATGVQGEPLNFAASIGGANLVGNHSVTWNFGDGSSPIGYAITGAWPTQTHVYTTPGSYTVTVYLLLSDGRFTSATLPVTISGTEVRTEPGQPDHRTLVVGGTEEDDLLRVIPAGTTGVQVWNRGEFLGTFADIDQVIVHGYAGNDYMLGATVGNVEMRFFGGDGNDVLIGTGGDDVLMGDAGNDFIQGGDGRDLIVGGAGTDSLHGQEGSDLLLAAVLSLPNLQSGLSDIIAEWKSPRSLTERIDNLQGDLSGPRANGDTLLLAAQTAFDDFLAIDRLTGGPGEDWYLANLDGDQIRQEPGTDELTDLVVIEP